MTIYTKAMDIAKKAALMLGLVLTINGATAGPILNPATGGSYQIDFHEPIGQSFVAQDSFVKASLWYNVINTGFPVDPITLSLYSGHGTGGTLLASDTFLLGAGYNGFFDSDFSSVSLSVGSTYSIAASTAGTSPYWGISPGAAYAGGAGFVFGGPDPGTDFAFRITPTVAAPVPEPETYAMLLAGLGLLGFVARRRKLAATA
ncbi:MAG: FxDxF family PEP-CTERM protein [Rhodocyclales bacterium]|nr:FxDxF family PEP-CTERM protein [Rhodocyclales bacterium]